MTPGRVRFALALALVLLLEGLSRFGFIDRFAMIPPSEILWHLGRILSGGEINLKAMNDMMRAQKIVGALKDDPDWSKIIDESFLPDDLRRKSQ